MPQTKFQYSTDEMFVHAGLLPLRDQIHANRLRLLARLVKSCATVLWMLITAYTGSGSWQELCLDSCRWFAMHHDRPLSVGADSSFLDWARQSLEWQSAQTVQTRTCISPLPSRSRHLAEALGSQVASPWCHTPRQKHIQSNAADKWQCDLCEKLFSP